MNQAAGNVKAKSQKPHNEQNRNDCPKHFYSPILVLLPKFKGHCFGTLMGRSKLVFVFLATYAYCRSKKIRFSFPSVSPSLVRLVFYFFCALPGGVGRLVRCFLGSMFDLAPSRLCGMCGCVGGVFHVLL